MAKAPIHISRRAAGALTCFEHATECGVALRRRIGSCETGVSMHHVHARAEICLRIAARRGRQRDAPDLYTVHPLSLECKVVFDVKLHMSYVKIKKMGSADRPGSLPYRSMSVPSP
jgi:hypothetical protein